MYFLQANKQQHLVEWVNVLKHAIEMIVPKAVRLSALSDNLIYEVGHLQGKDQVPHRTDTVGAVFIVILAQEIEIR